MAEYIDKTKLIADGWVMSRIYKQDAHTMMYESKKIADIPSENVVPVVRCKDCKHYKTAYCSMDIWHKDVTIYRAKPNDFCSRGELKEQNDDATTD